MVIKIFNDVVVKLIQFVIKFGLVITNLFKVICETSFYHIY